MGTVTALDEVNRIRCEFAEYDLAHSKDPLDRRRFEKQVEQQAQKAREAEQNQQTENWKAYIEGRIRAWFEDYFGADEDGASGHYADAIGQVVATERRNRRLEVKTAVEEERRSVDANLEALERASNERWVATDQHIERAREHVLQSTSEMFEQFRAESREEFKLVLAEKERALDAKLAEMEQRLKSSPGKLPVVKTWRPGVIWSG